MARLRLLSLALFCFSFSQAGLSASLESCTSTSERSKCLKDWTVLIYMAVDTDMKPYAWLDLYEMEAGYDSGKKLAGSTLKSDVLVELNSVDSLEAERRHILQSPISYSKSVYSKDLKSLDFTEIKSPIIQRVKKTGKVQKPAALAKSFESFVRWGLEKYPARSTWVIYWGHGEGWLDSQSEIKAQSIFISQNQKLSRPEPMRLKTALENALDAASNPSHHPEKIDVFATDSCFMQMAEVLTELAPITRYVMGSSQVQSYAGLPYRRILAELNSGHFGGELRSGLSPSTDEAYALVKMIPTLMRKSLSPGGLAYELDRKSRENFSLNSVSTDEMGKYLLPALRDLSSALAHVLKSNPELSLDLSMLLAQAPHFAGSAPDLGAFLDLLRQWSVERLNETQSTRLLAHINRAKSALHRSVVNFELGTSYPAGLRGLSLWIPSDTVEYESQISGYLKSKFYLLTGFNQWLQLAFKPIQPQNQ